MPKRTRSHVLETESMNFIRNLIPLQWVIRVPQPDYGIDMEVEIFEKNNQDTGLVFFIQAKGTDESNIEKSLSYRMTIEKLRYYNSLPIPVLLIRYLSSQKQGYAKWIHSIDPYYKRKGSKSLNVKFLSEESFTNALISQIPEQLKLFRSYKNPIFPFPMKFQLLFENDTICGVATGIISSLLNKKVSEINEYLIITTEHSTSYPSIMVSNDEITVDILGLARCVLHHRGKYNKDEIYSELSNDVFVAAAVALYQLGHTQASAVIFYETVFSSGIINNQNLIKIVISCFIEAKRQDLAIKLSKQALEIYKDNFLHIMFGLPVFKKTNLNEDELIAYEELFLLAARKAIENGFNQNAGMSYYNIANRLKAISKYLRKSVKYYNLALKYDPDYSTRDYYWSELAGVFFDKRKYNWSSKCYKKSLELKNSNEIKPLYADALMFSGKYKEALSVFQDYIKNDKDVDPEWNLKSISLQKLIEEYGIYEQKRDIKNAIKNADTTKFSDGTNKEKLEKSLRYDLLCGLAWYNLGIDYSNKSDFDQASFSFVMAGLVQPNDTEAWANAILCIMNIESTSLLLSTVFTHAYSINGENFYLKLIEQIEKQPEDKISKTKKNELINILGSCTDLLNKDKSKNEDDAILRIFSDDNSYVTY